MAKVELKKIGKVYEGNVRAVDDANIVDQRQGVRDFRRSLGLRQIHDPAHDRRPRGHHRGRAVHRRQAGQRRPAQGPRHRDGVPELRPLSPHDRLREHGLRAQASASCPRTEIDKRVKEAARILDIEKLLERRPKQLSGGQRQRVAVGRAIVRNPKVFLFDEPLSNLDAKLRVQMRAELIDLHYRLDATMIYVTHDQVEAMTMGDKIVVMQRRQDPADRLARSISTTSPSTSSSRASSVRRP